MADRSCNNVAACERECVVCGPVLKIFCVQPTRCVCVQLVLIATGKNMMRARRQRIATNAVSENRLTTRAVLIYGWSKFHVSDLEECYSRPHAFSKVVERVECALCDCCV